MLPWKLLKNPIPVDKVLVTKLDVNITFDVIFAEEILLTKMEFVLKFNNDKESLSAITVESDEMPSAKIE